MSNQATNQARVIPLRPASSKPRSPEHRSPAPHPAPTAPVPKEPLLRDLVGDVLRRERLAQERTLKDVAESARISMPYLSEVERGRKEASSEVLAAAAHALGLGLGDLLARAHGELTRTTARRATGVRATSAPRHGGLCLAA